MHKCPFCDEQFFFEQHRVEHVLEKHKASVEPDFPTYPFAAPTWAVNRNNTWVCTNAVG